MSDQPDLPAGLLVRRRLLEALGGAKPWTVVSAPAGYGKSALVQSWAAERSRDLTIVRSALDDEDMSVEPVWQTVVEAFSAAGVHGQGRAASGDAGRGPVGALAADIATHGRPVVWVLDCGEFSLSPEAGRDVGRLMRAARGTLTLVMLTRHDPPLPMHRLRLDGVLREIRADELAFTAGEVAALMKREGVDLTPPEVSALRTRTGGWPAGLRFAAMGLRGRADVSDAIATFRGDTGNVAEYLMSEVLQRQPTERREFLLRSCIVDELDPPLVSALTGQHCDVQVLQSMADGECFVERIPGQRDRFRYHALFRQFLRAQLLFEESPAPEGLHRVAARWLAQDGQWSRAVTHAVAATDWPLATGLLVGSLGFVQLLSGPRSTALKRLLTGLPTSVGGVDAALTRAALALTELDPTAAGPHLDIARAALAEESPQPRLGCTVAVAVLEALQKSMTLSTDASLDVALHAVLHAEETLRPLPALAQRSLGSHLVAVVAACKGRVLFTRGEFLGAVEALREGIAAAEAADLATVAGELRGMSALVDAVIGHLRRASATAVQASHSRVATTAHPTRRTSEAAKLALAWVRTEEVEPVLAQELVAQATREQASYDSELLGSVASLLRARLVTDRGDVSLALMKLRVALEQLRLPPDAGTDTPAVARAAGSNWLARALLLAQADALTRLGRHRDAVALVRELADEAGRRDLDTEIALQHALIAAEDPGRDVTELSPARRRHAHDEVPLSLTVDRFLVLAEGSIADGDVPAGLGFLGQALRTAAPEHLRRPILQAPDDVQDLLTTSGLAARNRWLTVPSDAAGGGQHNVHIPEQRHATEGHVHAPSGPVVIPLTKKETEVLGYLAKLLTTDEIAAAMLVSVNTVRSHVRSILRKLGVSRRNEAVRRAWDLQLLPPDSAA
jgi:LuxR family transcriptional regulator, maltose regulon positive regulatory protein